MTFHQDIDGQMMEIAGAGLALLALVYVTVRGRAASLKRTLGRIL